MCDHKNELWLRMLRSLWDATGSLTCFCLEESDGRFIFKTRLQVIFCSLRNPESYSFCNYELKELAKAVETKHPKLFAYFRKYIVADIDAAFSEPSSKDTVAGDGIA